jgi:hypothetical protein
MQIQNKKWPRFCLTLSAMAMLSALPSVQAATSSSAAPANSQQVFFVGNNWDGTVTVIRPSGDFGKIGVINMIPDRKERLKEIHLNPIKLIAYTYIQTTAGEGNDQLVDDMYSTPDGQSVVASRPSFADVVSISKPARLTGGRLLKASVPTIWRYHQMGNESPYLHLQEMWCMYWISIPVKSWAVSALAINRMKTFTSMAATRS